VTRDQEVSPDLLEYHDIDGSTFANEKQLVHGEKILT
jgi:hypothetical protein